jgi:SAM-dependent methyltransferase
MRTVVGGRAKNQAAASTSEMARFETEILSSTENLKHLMDLSGKWIDQAHCHRKLTRLILDMDSSVSETYGHQQGNGYFACTCYHPLFLFNQFGDLERVLLRRGNHPSAKFWRRVLLPAIERYRDRDIPKYFRGDSAFALPKLLRLLEKEGFRYAIRLEANPVLERKIAPLLKRPVGRPSRQPKVFYASFRYQAKSWQCTRRVVAKVEWHAGELFPRVGLIVTNLRWPTKRVVRFYNRRGTAEQWIKEGKNAVKWTKLSYRRFKDNSARLQLFALAYNLASFLRQLVLPKPIQGWTLTTLREKLVETMTVHPGDRVLDLGCGCGTNGIFAAQQAGSEGHITFVDSNVRAIALTDLNARGNGVTAFQTIASRQVEGLQAGSFDVILANPPLLRQQRHRPAVPFARARPAETRWAILCGDETSRRDRRSDDGDLRARRSADAPRLYDLVERRDRGFSQGNLLIGY